MQNEAASQQTKRDERRFRVPSLSLRLGERRLLLVALDIFLLCLSLVIALRLRTELVPTLMEIWPNYKWYVTLGLLWMLVASVLDIYNLEVAANPGLGGWVVVRAVAFTTIAYLAIPWLTPPLQNRSQGFLFVLLATISVTVWRLLYARVLVRPVFLRRVLVVGAGWSGRTLAEAIRTLSASGESAAGRGGAIQIVGFVDDDPKQPSTVEGLPVVGDSTRLAQLVDELDIDEIVIAITDTKAISPRLFEAILDCRERSVAVVAMTTFYERVTGRVAFEHASRNIETVTGRDDADSLRFYGLVKRIIDIVGAIVGLAVMLPMLPLLALVNRMTCPGPLFFRQRRVGKGGRVFEVIKFRSMRPDAERDIGPTWAAESDQRVTSVGRWLRKTHLDELPQVINVLRGEMSLVGPRPERPEFVDLLSDRVPFYRARHSVQPGITGWAQIHQNYGDSIEKAREKLEYDFFYIKRAGPILDTVILLRTISKVLSFQGR
ncbi:MAG: sugar transferase [Candidatus Promineifilaceae bacterium]|nr:sugar transferase [Candidatus Promineifilaceae bacterium]